MRTPDASPGLDVGGTTGGDLPPLSPPHPLLRHLWARFEAVYVRWCLLRGEHDLERPDGDVDVLVDPRDLERAESVLRDAGGAMLRAPGRGTHRKWLVPDRSSDDIFAIDLVTALDYGRFSELHTGCAHSVLANRRVDGGVFLPGDADRFWLLLLHATLDGAAIDEATLGTLSTLARRTSLDNSALAVACSRLLGPAETHRLVETLTTGQRPEAIPRPDTVVVAARRVLRGLARRTSRPVLRRRRGMIVALLGPDGAGKSSLVAEPPAWPFAVTTAYGGLYPNGGPHHGLAGRLVRYRRLHARLRAPARAGQLVILDRHPWDVFALPAGRSPWKRPLQRWLVALTCPAPDAIIVLDAPGELLHERSCEHDPDVLEAQRRRYRALDQHLPWWRRRPVMVIIATGDIHTVRADLATTLWALLRQRLEARSGWWPA